MSAEFAAAIFYKFIGALAGAALALVFIPPRTVQGFMRRLAAALIFGTIFAPYARGWAGFDPDGEGMIAAACLTAFASWWLMGAIKRAADAWRGPKVPADE